MNFSKNDLLKQFFLFDNHNFLYIICDMVVILLLEEIMNKNHVKGNDGRVD